MFGHAYSDFREVELSDVDWFRIAHECIDDDCFLLTRPGRGERRLAGPGGYVVFVLEGYHLQYANLNKLYSEDSNESRLVDLQQPDPTWVSHVGLWQREQYGLSSSRKEFAQCLGGAAQAGLSRPLDRLKMEEQCRVVRITYHRRIPYAATAADIEQLLHPQQPNTDSSESLPEFWQAVRGSDGSSAADANNVGKQTGLFARITLQKCKVEGGRSWMQDRLVLQPCFASIDYHLDAGSGDFLLDRAKFMYSISKPWMIGDRVKMFFRSESDQRYAAWYHGTVKKVKTYDRRDPKRGSNWGRLCIEWDDNGDEHDWVSAWEVWPEEEEDRRRTGGDLSPPYEAWGWDSEGEPINSDEIKQGRPKRWIQKRRRPASAKQQAAGIAGVQPALPETMLVNKQKLKMDWNDDFCSICHNEQHGQAVECDGTCLRMFHVNCLEPELRPSPLDPADAPWYCQDCRAGKVACSVCGQQGEAGEGIYKCSMGTCGRYYHPACLKQLRPHLKLKVLPPGVSMRGGQKLSRVSAGTATEPAAAPAAATRNTEQWGGRSSSALRHPSAGGSGSHERARGQSRQRKRAPAEASEVQDRRPADYGGRLGSAAAQNVARPDVRRSVAAAASAAAAAAWAAGSTEREHWETGLLGTTGSGSGSGGLGAGLTPDEAVGGISVMQSAAGQGDDVDFADDEVLQGRICCPAHFCQSCHMSGDAIKLVRCWLCPRAYHTGCLHDLADRVSSKYIECPWCVATYHPEFKRQQQEAQRQQAPAAPAAGPQPPSAAAATAAAKSMGINHVASYLPASGSISSSSIGRSHGGARSGRSGSPAGPLLLNTGLLLDATRQALRDPSIVDLQQLEVAGGGGAAGCAGQQGWGLSDYVVKVTPLCGPEPRQGLLLVGKSHWHFGTHLRGGGVEFLVPVTGSKLHTKLVLQEDGAVHIRPMYKSNFLTPTLLNNRPISKHQDHILGDKDIIQIGPATFQVDFVPKDSPAAAEALAGLSQSRSTRQPLPLGFWTPGGAAGLTQERDERSGGRDEVPPLAAAARTEAGVAGGTSATDTAAAAEGAEAQSKCVAGRVGEAIASLHFGSGCRKQADTGAGIVSDLRGLRGPQLKPRKGCNNKRNSDSSSTEEDVDPYVGRGAGLVGRKPMGRVPSAAAAAAEEEQRYRRYPARSRQRPKAYWMNSSDQDEQDLHQRGLDQVHGSQEGPRPAAAAAAGTTVATCAVAGAMGRAAGVGAGLEAWEARGHPSASRLRCKNFPVASERYKHIVSNEDESSMGALQGGSSAGADAAAERLLSDPAVDAQVSEPDAAATSKAHSAAPSCAATAAADGDRGYVGSFGLPVCHHGEAAAATSAAARAGAAAVAVQGAGAAGGAAPASSDDLMGLEWSSDEEPWGSSSSSHSGSSGSDDDDGCEGFNAMNVSQGVAPLSAEEHQHQQLENKVASGTLASALATGRQELAAAGRKGAPPDDAAGVAAFAGGVAAGLGPWPVGTANAVSQQPATAAGVGDAGRVPGRLQLRLKVSAAGALQQGHGSRGDWLAPAVPVWSGVTAPSPQNSSGSSRKITIKRHNSSGSLSSRPLPSSSRWPPTVGPPPAAAASTEKLAASFERDTGLLPWGCRCCRTFKHTTRRVDWGAGVSYEAAAADAYASDSVATCSYHGRKPSTATAAGATPGSGGLEGNGSGVRKLGRPPIRRYRSLSELYPLTPGVAAAAAGPVAGGKRVFLLKGAMCTIGLASSMLEAVAGGTATAAAVVAACADNITGSSGAGSTAVPILRLPYRAALAAACKGELLDIPHLLQLPPEQVMQRLQLERKQEQLGRKLLQEIRRQQGDPQQQQEQEGQWPKWDWQRERLRRQRREQLHHQQQQKQQEQHKDSLQSLEAQGTEPEGTETAGDVMARAVGGELGHRSDSLDGYLKAQQLVAGCGIVGQGTGTKKLTSRESSPYNVKIRMKLPGLLRTPATAPPGTEVATEQEETGGSTADDVGVAAADKARSAVAAIAEDPCRSAELQNTNVAGNSNTLRSPKVGVLRLGHGGKYCVSFKGIPVGRSLGTPDVQQLPVAGSMGNSSSNSGSSPKEPGNPARRQALLTLKLSLGSRVRVVTSTDGTVVKAGRDGAGLHTRAQGESSMGMSRSSIEEIPGMACLQLQQSPRAITAAGGGRGDGMGCSDGYSEGSAACASAAMATDGGATAAVPPTEATAATAGGGVLEPAPSNTAMAIWSVSEAAQASAAGLVAGYKVGSAAAVAAAEDVRGAKLSGFDRELRATTFEAVPAVGDIRSRAVDIACSPLVLFLSNGRYTLKRKAAPETSPSSKRVKLKLKAAQPAAWGSNRDWTPAAAPFIKLICPQDP